MTDGYEIREVQHEGHFEHDVGVCDKWDKAGGADDDAAGVADGGDVR